MRARARYRHPQDRGEDEAQQRPQEPVAAEPDVDPRAIVEALRSAQPAGRGAVTVLARALARLQNGHGNAAVGRVLAARELARSSTWASGALLQRSLIATGSDADFDRFRALAEPASGLLLGRDPATNVVTAIGSMPAATSPAFANILTTMMDHPVQDAEIHFGAGQPNVLIGAFPTPSDMTGSRVQTIDIDDIEAVETGAPGHGVAFLAHEMHENFVAHAAAPAAGVDQFAAAHEQGNIAQGAVASDLAGTGGRVAERVAAGAVAGTLTAVADFETDFLVLDVTQTPGTTDTRITGSRQAGRVNVTDVTLDGFVTGSDVPPGGGQVATAAADLLAHPQATATIEGFTDDVGDAAVNDPLSRRRAEQVRAAIIAAGPGLIADNFHVAGRGATGFVAPNLTEADRRRNRRVRIRVEEPAP